MNNTTIQLQWRLYFKVAVRGPAGDKSEVHDSAQLLRHCLHQQRGGVLIRAGLQVIQLVSCCLFACILLSNLIMLCGVLVSVNWRRQRIFLFLRRQHKSKLCPKVCLVFIHFVWTMSTKLPKFNGAFLLLRLPRVCFVILKIFSPYFTALG